MNTIKSYSNLSIHLLISIVFIFTILSPTVNFLLLDFQLVRVLIQVSIAIILTLLFSFYRANANGLYIILFSILLALFTLNPITILKNTSCFFFILIFSNKYKNTFKNIIIIIFFINAFLIIGQLLGINEWFYKFQDYANDTDPTIGEFNFGESMDTAFGYLPQIRPSGIFPSPTYISFYCIFFWYYILMNTNFNNKFIFFFFGFILMLLGSTLALFLLILSIFLINYKKEIKIFLLGGIVGALFYIYSFPSTFTYNFNFEEFIASFLVRIIDSGVNDESILISNPFLFFIILFLIVSSAIFLRKIGAINILLKSMIVMILPLMIHEAISSIQYWVTVSFFVSEILNKQKIQIIYFNKYLIQ
jgi:hypothetical protein